VAILSDTNIWCVGEIHPQDSAGQTIPFYNIVQWNGKTWNLNRVYYQFQGQQYLAKVTAIFAFGERDIWIGSNQPMHWNGVGWEEFDVQANIFQGYIIRFFGTSSSNLYMVGANGAIARFGGSSWQKLSAPTNFDIMDIYGAIDTRTGGQEILAIASQYNVLPLQTQLLRIQGTSVTQVGPAIPDWYFSLWFVPGEKYHIVGNGIISKNSLSDTVWSNNPIGTLTRYSSTCIRGINRNDLFVVGSFFDVAHYNGSSWHNYQNELPYGDGVFSCVAINGNTVIIGGQSGQNAVIVMGKR
jgi:hypothetical protein